MSKIKFEGIMPALVTPFEEDNKTVNEQVTKNLIDLYLNQGASGFYILGRSFADSENRTLNALPKIGMSRKEFARYSYADGIERTFRKEPAIKFFKKHFEI